jgi:hypothetical protein
MPRAAGPSPQVLEEQQRQELARKAAEEAEAEAARKAKYNLALQREEERKAVRPGARARAGGGLSFMLTQQPALWGLGRVLFRCWTARPSAPPCVKGHAHMKHAPFRPTLRTRRSGPHYARTVPAILGTCWLLSPPLEQSA